MAISGFKSIVKVTSDPVAFVDGATTTTDDKTYTLTDDAFKTLDYNTSVTVYEDGVETTEDYTVRKLQGQIVFDTVDATRGVITVDGNYLPLVTVAKANEYSLSLNGDSEDVTPFQSEFTIKKQTLKSAEVSISTFYEEVDAFLPILLNGEVVVLELSPDVDSTQKYRLYSRLASDEVSVGVSSIIGESLNFESTNSLIADL